MKKIKLAATTSFGLESSLKREISQLGLEISAVQDGKIFFEGSDETLIDANLYLRCADRVLLSLKTGHADNFDDLYDLVFSLPWGDYISEKANFRVLVKTSKSQLTSVPACQSVCEKALINRLKVKYKIEWFEKSGPDYQILIHLHENIVDIYLDTSGIALHKRSYRLNNVEAPLKETLAAALVELSFYRKDKLLLDCFCGGGTIPIEAAQMMNHIPPGLNRSFAFEKYGIIPPRLWKERRDLAESKITHEALNIIASDVDPRAIQFSKENAKRAGVEKYIRFEEKDYSKVSIEDERACLISNPPYGIRVGEDSQIIDIYRGLGEKFNHMKLWNLYILSSDERFETYFGRKANKKRKLFNGNIKTQYYQFYSLKPSK